MSRLISTVIIYVILYIQVIYNPALSLLERRYINDFNNQKKYFSSFFKTQNYYFSCEILENIFRTNRALKYQIYVRSQYDLTNENFLLFKHSILQERKYCHFFKHIVLIGYGCNILNGPVYYSQIECSPCLYYIRENNKNYLKILAYSSGTYSYQLINNIYYTHCFSALANFGHLVTKLENSLKFSIRNDTIFLKCGYNIVFNENKFYKVLPNVNKYIAISLVYFL